MATDIEHQAEVLEMSESGLVLTQMDKIKFNFDKYNPTRGGKFIPLPNGFKARKRVSTSKTKTTSVSSIPFNVVYVRFMRKTIPNAYLTIKM